MESCDEITVGQRKTKRSLFYIYIRRKAIEENANMSHHLALGGTVNVMSAISFLVFKEREIFLSR